MAFFCRRDRILTTLCQGTGRYRSDLVALWSLIWMSRILYAGSCSSSRRNMWMILVQPISMMLFLKASEVFIVTMSKKTTMIPRFWMHSHLSTMRSTFETGASTKHPTTQLFHLSVDSLLRYGSNLSFILREQLIHTRQLRLTYGPTLLLESPPIQCMRTSKFVANLQRSTITVYGAKGMSTRHMKGDVTRYRTRVPMVNCLEVKRCLLFQCHQIQRIIMMIMQVMALSTSILVKLSNWYRHNLASRLVVLPLTLGFTHLKVVVHRRLAPLDASALAHNRLPSRQK